ncbi:MAG: RDD family protein [Steroidobacteraceae bacterium]
MKTSGRWLLPFMVLLSGCVLAPSSRAQDDSGWSPDYDRHIVSIGHDAVLGKGEKAEVVVSVLGSSYVEGDVQDSVVAILGDAHVTGHVGDSAIAVLGDVYIDSRVEGNVVAVLGNLKLGPQAVIEGQLVEVLGTVERSPSAVIEGGTVGVLSGLFASVGGLQAWVRHCLVYARPLAPDPALGWVWGIALAVLAFYLLLAAVFRDGLRRCVQTLDAHPGPSILAAFIATLLAPVLTMVLAITVIGIALIPFVWIGVFCAGIFGRVVALGWLGGRCLRLVVGADRVPVVLSVLLGGIVVLALYMVPLLGFVVYGLIGVLGFGALVYTLVLGAKATRERPIAGGPYSAPTGGGPPEGTGGGSDGNESAGGSAGGPGPGAAPGPSERPRDSWHTPATDPHAAATCPRAGFWPRMGALLIDLVLVGFALSLFYHGFRGTLLILAAYAAIMWKLRGTTIGGIVFDLQVARLDGRPIEWETAIIRALACFLSLAILGLGFLWIAIDPEHQAWHDKIAGTVVVRVAKGVALV